MVTGQAIVIRKNWDIAAVPINDGTNQYVVNIPSGSVNYNVIDDPGMGYNEVLQFHACRRGNHQSARP